MIEGIIIGLISAVFGGLIVWIITEHAYKMRRPKFPQNFGEYSGKWYGIHLSKREGTKGYIISHHQYDLKISSSGKVKGLLEELDSSPHWMFQIDGLLSGNGLVLISEAKNVRPGFYTAEFYPSLSLVEVNYGLLTSFDGRNDPFSAPIAIAKRKLEKRELENAIKCMENRFYIDLI